MKTLIICLFAISPLCAERMLMQKPIWKEKTPKDIKYRIQVVEDSLNDILMSIELMKEAKDEEDKKAFQYIIEAEALRAKYWLGTKGLPKSYFEEE